MWSNAGMANRQGDFDMRFAQVSASSEHFGFAWKNERQFIRKGVTVHNTSRKTTSRQKTGRLTARPRCLWTGHTTAHPGHPASAHQHQSPPPKSHRGIPGSQPRDQRSTIARGLPEASSLHGYAALLRSQHRSKADDKITASKPRPHLSDFTTLDLNKYLYICVVL